MGINIEYKRTPDRPERLKGGSLDSLCMERLPLGCARLRMSCLPVVTTDRIANAWEKVPNDVPPDQRVREIAVPYKVEEKK